MDSAIITAAKQGDQAAWRDLYGVTAPAVRGYLRARRVREPDDLLGAVFLDVARGIRGFEGDEQQFKAWVFTIAHRRWVDEIRAAQRRPTASLDELLDTDSGVDVEEDAARVIEREALLWHVDDLPAAQRSVILLKVLGDLSHAEIADVLGKSVTAVRVNYHRALKALRWAMEPAPVVGPGSPVLSADNTDVTI